MLMPPYDDEAPLPKRFEVSLPRNREFLGHDSLFSVIQRKLRSVPMFILTGVAGIGKTQFALEYAYRHRDDYHFVWWIDGQSAQTMRRAHLDIANALGVPRSKSEEERIELVFTRLNANSNWLLVYDDVCGPAGFLPAVSDVSRWQSDSYLAYTLVGHPWDEIPAGVLERSNQP